MTEDWPDCTTMASVASDADWAQLDPDFKAGKKALGAEDWNGAIAALELAALRDPLNADIQNYIGDAHRRLRQLGPAIGLSAGADADSVATAARMSISARPIWCLATRQGGATPGGAGESLPYSLRGIRRPQACHRRVIRLATR